MQNKTEHNVIYVHNGCWHKRFRAFPFSQETAEVKSQLQVSYGNIIIA